MASNDSLAIGIDLGTTNTCAYYYIDGRLESLENKEGSRLTPSCVYFTSKKILVGQYAKKMALYEPGKGISCIKRFIGRSLEVAKAKFEKLFLSVVNIDNKMKVSFEMEEGSLYKTPQEICAIILAKIKKDAEDKLGCTISKAVVTVPAYFDSSQRRATLEAANEAGLVVLKLLNEPNASALNYYFETEIKANEQYYLVYDLGGGTFDVSILKKVKENVQVIAVDGDTQLGGNDFDELLAEYISGEVKTRYGCDLKKDNRDMNELLMLCEEAKRNLSFFDETFIMLKALVRSENRDVKITLTRQKLEELIINLLIRTITITNRCVQSAEIDRACINEVIMAGGSSRIPKIRSLLSEYFNGRKLSKIINPDESVAKGAALQAAMLSQHPRQKVNEIKIVDIVPLSLGFEQISDVTKIMIRKNTPIPASSTCSSTNVYANDECVLFPICEGERPRFSDNVFLGELTMDITPCPPRQSSICLTMTVDSNGILTFTGKDKTIGVVNELIIKSYTRGIRNDEEIKMAIENAEKCKDEDARFERLSSLNNYLHNYCISAIYNMSTKSLQDEHEKTYDRCIELKKLAFSSNEEIETKRLITEITQKCEPLIEQHKFEYMPKPISL